MTQLILKTLAVLLVGATAQAGEIVCFEKQNNLFFTLNLNHTNSQGGEAELISPNGHSVLVGHYSASVIGPGTRTSGMTQYEIDLQQASPDFSLYQGMKLSLIGNADYPTFGSGQLETPKHSGFKKTVIFSCTNFAT